MRNQPVDGAPEKKRRDRCKDIFNNEQPHRARDGQGVTLGDGGVGQVRLMRRVMHEACSDSARRDLDAPFLTGRFRPGDGLSGVGVKGT